MVTIDKKEHTDILEQSIKHLEYLGFENIKADIDGYETPISFTLPCFCNSTIIVYLHPRFL